MSGRGPTGGHSLSIVMPCWNERGCIERAVDEALRCGDRLLGAGRVIDFECIVVDDGSDDGSGSLLDRRSELHPNLVVVHHDRNRGLGAALRSGFATARCDLVFYTDADLPVDLLAVDLALGLLEADPALSVVAAYRTDRRGEGARRLVYSVVYNSLVRRVLGLDITDVNFAAKLIRTDALVGVELQSEGSFIDAELLARLARRGCSMAQFAADYHPRSTGTSTLSSPRVIRQILVELASLAKAIRRERPVSLEGVRS